MSAVRNKLKWYLAISLNVLATPRGFEPLISTVTGWHVKTATPRGHSLVAYQSQVYQVKLSPVKQKQKAL